MYEEGVEEQRGLLVKRVDGRGYRGLSLGHRRAYRRYYPSAYSHLCRLFYYLCLYQSYYLKLYLIYL